MSCLRAPHSGPISLGPKGALTPEQTLRTFQAGQGLRDDVNVNWIHPGLTVTERLEEIFARRAEQQGTTRDEIEQHSIAAEGLRRLGQPEDVAELVVFLCSPAARHIHGTGIAVDGGGSKGYQ